MAVMMYATVVKTQTQSAFDLIYY